jgi:hypothetical protein
LRKTPQIGEKPFLDTMLECVLSPHGR